MNNNENEFILKPCPFCGGRAKFSLMLSNYHVTCTKCMGAVFPYKGMTRKDAAEAWNTRTPIDSTIVNMEKELALADEEKERCARENPLQFDRAVGYATGVYNTLEAFKEAITKEF